jgi:hypothetical protein
MKKTIGHVYLLMTSAAVACLLAAAPARADVELSTQSVNVQPGDNNDSFQVLLTNTGSMPVDIGAYAFELTTTDSALTFTDSTTQATTNPYIFAGDSFVDTYEGGVTSTTSPGQVLDADDLALSASGAMLNAGATASLGTVYFDIAPGAARGVIPIAFNTNAAVTNLSGPAGNAIAVGSFDPGDVVVTPEPPMMILIAAMLLLMWFGIKRRAKVNASNA